MPTDREEKIRQRAYELWENDGAQHGRDQDYWHEAAEQIDAEERAESAPDTIHARKPTTTAAKPAKSAAPKRKPAKAADGEAPKKRGRPRKTDSAGDAPAPAKRKPKASKKTEE